MGRTKRELEELERTRGVQLGREMLRKIAEGKCPRCGNPLDPEQPTRRIGEDHETYALGGLEYVPCGCDAGCGHIPVRKRKSTVLMSHRQNEGA